MVLFFILFALFFQKRNSCFLLSSSLFLNFEVHCCAIFSRIRFAFIMSYLVMGFKFLTGKALKGQSQKVQQAVLEVIVLFFIIFWLLAFTLFSNRNFELANTMLLLPHQLVKKAWISWKWIL